MRQPILCMSTNNLSAGTKYGLIYGAGPWGAALITRQLVTAPGQVSDLRVVLDVAPGAGASYAFTLEVNGAPTALTCSISGADTVGSDTTHSVALSQWDEIRLRAVSTGAVANTRTRYSCIFKGTNGKESILPGGVATLSGAGLRYNNLAGGAGWDSVAGSRRQGFPADGIIKDLLVRMLPVVEGWPCYPENGKSYTFTLMVNGVATALTCTISNLECTGSDTTHSVVVSPGDIVVIRCTPSNTPKNRNAIWGTTFLADAEGESIIIGGGYPLKTEVVYLPLSNGQSGPTTVEGNVEQPMPEFSLSNWYIGLTDNPGAGTKWDYVIRKNNADTDLAITIEDAESAGNDTTHVVKFADDDVCIKITPTGAPPGAGSMHWGVKVSESVADGVYIELAGIEVQSKAYGIRVERGRETELGYAPAGVAELTMDNSEGDFSPENAGGAYYGTLDLGISVYIYEIYDGVTYDLLTGQIEKIVPQDVAGDGGAQAFLLCTDGMDDLVGTIVETPVRTSVKAGQLIEDILDDAAAFVGKRDIDTGITVFDVAFFSGKEALPQIRTVEDQERGRFYIDVDGDAQFEDRHHRILNHHTSEYDFGTKLRAITYEWSKRDLYNRIQVTGTKYTAAITGNEYIWGTEAGVAATAIIVPANGSVTIWVITPEVIESYVTPLVKGTHWNTNTEVDKSGADTSDSITVTEVQYGKAIKLTFTSTYNADSFLVVPDSPPADADANRTAIIMGKTYTEDVIQHVEEYSASQASYRKKGMALTVPFLGDPDELRTLASFIGTRHKDPQPMAIRVTIHGRTDWPTDDILKQVLSRKISDRITLASTLLGFDQDFYIEKVIHDYKQFEGKFNLDVSWVCSRASGQDILTWLLDDGAGTYAGFGELEETTYLSY